MTDAVNIAILRARARPVGAGHFRKRDSRPKGAKLQPNLANALILTPFLPRTAAPCCASD
jgi:hypothetical protein